VRVAKKTSTEIDEDNEDEARWVLTMAQHSAAALQVDAAGPAYPYKSGEEGLNS
jgi:hypothetical protein